MPSRNPIRRLRRSTHAFTLVEVALALGIAGFVLAGLIGAIPLASDVGRQSITQNRAASIAGTIFTRFRSHPFSKVPHLDAAPAASESSAPNPLDLNKLSTADSAKYYAYFDEVTMTGTAPDDDKRRLHFVATPPAGVTAFQITLRFNNNPPGTLAPDATTPHAQANAVEASIVAVARPRDVYRFNSVVANRSE